MAYIIYYDSWYILAIKDSMSLLSWNPLFHRITDIYSVQQSIKNSMGEKKYSVFKHFSDIHPRIFGGKGCILILGVPDNPLPFSMSTC